MKRVSRLELGELAESMSVRDRHIVEAVGRFRLLSGSQLGRLFFNNVAHAASRGRAVRRALSSLAEQHVVYPLPRRVGGVRAGSAGQVVGLGPVGKRLMAYWQGQGLVRVRTAHEPGPLFVRHSLAVAEQYVSLRVAEQSGHCELLSFEAEPNCWRTYTSGYGSEATLKPDGYIRVGVGEFEQRSFLEVDLGNTGRGALARKCRAYVSLYSSGQEAVFPKVVWITTSQPRVRLLVDVCSSLSPDYWQLFSVGLPERLVALCTGFDEPVATAAGTS